jgi:hypothetical protein
MGWATFWATFSATHLVTLSGRYKKLAESFFSSSAKASRKVLEHCL